MVKLNLPPLTCLECSTEKGRDSANEVRRGFQCAKIAFSPGSAKATAMPKVGFLSLGCPKNLVDSEVMMGILTGIGTS